jgi:tetratricopeptide (TPR) repeat protein
VRDGRGLIDRGRAALARGNWAEAVGSLTEAADRFPRYADVRHWLGLALHHAGRSEEALEQLGAAIALNPAFAEAHLNRGLVLNDLGRLDEARAHFERAAESERGRAGGLPRAARHRLAALHAELGDVYRGSGLLAEAVREYARALALAPSFHDVRLRLARAHLDGGSTTLAASEFGKVLAATPQSVQARLGLGLVHLQRGDRDRARAVWRECRDLAPGDPLVEVYLASV